MPISGIRCWVSGFTNPRTFAHDFQRQVDLPIIDTTTCQNLLRQTPLGSRYHLDASSFICAGGERGKGNNSIYKSFLSYFKIVILVHVTA